MATSQWTNRIAVVLFLFAGSLIGFSVYSSQQPRGDLDHEEDRRLAAAARDPEPEPTPPAPPNRPARVPTPPKPKDPRTVRGEEAAARRNAVATSAWKRIIAFSAEQTPETIADVEAAFADLRLAENLNFLTENPLRAVYQKLSRPEVAADVEVTETDWRKLGRFFDKWQAAMPAHSAPLIAKAGMLIKYAWVARGSGYAYTVTEEGSRLFHERIEQASEALDAAEKLAELDPEFYELRITISMAERDDRTRVSDFVTIAAKRWPTYYSLYQGAANYLLPRWRGEPGEVEAFANELFDLLDPETAGIAYFKVVQTVHGFDRDTLIDGEYDPQKLRMALLTALDYPELGYDAMAIAAEVAWRRQDLALAKRLAVERQTGPRPPGTADGRYVSAAVSLGESGESDLGDRFIWLPERIFTRSIDFSADGKTLAVATSKMKFPPVIFIDPLLAAVKGAVPPQMEGCVQADYLPTDENQLLLTLTDNATARFVLINSGESDPIEFERVQTDNLRPFISPDGRWIAAAKTNTGRIFIWDARTGKKYAEFDTRPHPQILFFSNDGRQIFASRENDGIYGYDLETGELQTKLVQEPGWNWHLESAAAFDAAGRLLVAAKPGYGLPEMTWQYVDLESREMTFSAPRGGRVYRSRLTANQRFLVNLEHNGQDNRAIVIDLRNNREIFNRPLMNSMGEDAALTPDGRILAVADDTGLIRFYDISTAE